MWKKYIVALQDGCTIVQLHVGPGKVGSLVLRTRRRGSIPPGSTTAAIKKNPCISIARGSTRTVGAPVLRTAIRIHNQAQKVNRNAKMLLYRHQPSLVTKNSMKIYFDVSRESNSSTFLDAAPMAPPRIAPPAAYPHNSWTDDVSG